MAQNVMYISDTELAGDLKNFYTDIRQELFPVSTATFSLFQKQGKGGSFRVGWGGNGAYFDIVVNPEVNWGWSTTGQLPYSSQAQEVQGSVGIARFYVTRAFDNVAMVGTESKQSAFTTLRQKIMDAFKNAMSLGMQESIHGAGTGARAIISSSADTTHFVATSPYGVVGAGQGGLWLYPNMYVAVYDTTGATLRGSAKISSVANSSDNVTVTLATAIAGMVATDVVYAANQSGDAKGAVMNGLINITNRGAAYNTLHGQTAATYGRWDATRFTAGTDTDTTTAAETDLWKLGATVKAKSGADLFNSPGEFACITTYGIGLQLIQSVLAQRAFQVKGSEKVSLPGGYMVDQILGVPLVMDEYCPIGTTYVVHRPSIGWVDLEDWAPVQYENSGAVRFIAGQDGFETSFRAYLNLMTKRRNAHGSIVSYTDTSRFTPVV